MRLLRTIIAWYFAHREWSMYKISGHKEEKDYAIMFFVCGLLGPLGLAIVIGRFLYVQYFR